MDAKDKGLTHLNLAIDVKYCCPSQDHPVYLSLSCLLTSTSAHHPNTAPCSHSIPPAIRHPNQAQSLSAWGYHSSQLNKPVPTCNLKSAPQPHSKQFASVPYPSGTKSSARSKLTSKTRMRTSQKCCIQVYIGRF